MRWKGHVAHVGERRGIYRILVGKPKGMRPLGKPRHRGEDNNKIIFGKWGYGLDRAGSGEGQVAGTCECSNEPLGSIKCKESFD